jgi:DNA (cytosine-5)-methyltransferase 1
MRILELFSGYGTASFALKQLGIDYELVGYSDIDKYANQCFRQNHCPVDMDREFGDCTKINPNDLDDFDLLTGGFPCQTFSIAGKHMGELDTRGTLFNEIIRIAAVKKPRYMLLENVKGLLSPRHEKTFQKILSELRRIGYHVHWKVLNTKEHGIPQNRERVFIVCFRDHNEWFNFQYPDKEELKLLLGDILEEHVDEKYYLSDEQVKRLIDSGFKEKDISNSIRSGGRNSLDNKHTWDVVKVGNVNPSGKGMNGNVYSGDVSPTLTTNKGEGIKILQLDVSQIRREKRVRVYEDVSRCLNTAQGGGHTPLIYQRGRGFNPGGIKKICPTISSNYWHQNNFLMEGASLRRLTPKECFRLQGFLNDEINMDGISNAQLYKLAGNGQSVNVVKKIFESMFTATSFLNEEIKNG